MLWTSGARTTSTMTSSRPYHSTLSAWYASCASSLTSSITTPPAFASPVQRPASETHWLSTSIANLHVSPAAHAHAFREMCRCRRSKCASGRACLRATLPAPALTTQPICPWTSHACPWMATVPALALRCRPRVATSAHAPCSSILLQACTTETLGLQKRGTCARRSSTPRQSQAAVSFR